VPNPNRTIAAQHPKIKSRAKPICADAALADAESACAKGLNFAAEEPASPTQTFIGASSVQNVSRSNLMRACHISAELPANCAEITHEALAREMKNEANIGMAQNAACQITNSDIDEISTLMMRLPKTLAV
jgi:hypothetical protein